MSSIHGVMRFERLGSSRGHESQNHECDSANTNEKKDARNVVESFSGRFCLLLVLLIMHEKLYAVFGRLQTLLSEDLLVIKRGHALRFGCLTSFKVLLFFELRL